MCKPGDPFNVTVTELHDKKFEGRNESINAIIEDQLIGNNQIPGGAVGIMCNNEVVYLKGFGFADIETKSDFTISTTAPIGSISKTLTALGILKLIDEGFIESVDDKIKKYLNIFNFPDLRISSLLKHASKLPQDPDWNGPFPNNEVELVEFLNALAQLGSAFNPSGKPIQYTVSDHPGIYPSNSLFTLLDTNPNSQVGQYSNVGYAILGAIIDSIKPYGKNYEEFIYWAIGLNKGILNGEDIMLTPYLDSYWRHDKIPNLSRGYEWIKERNSFVERKPSSVSNNNTGWWGPPGGWTMTIGDLVRLMIILSKNTRISSSLRDQMFSKQNKVISPNIGDYGFGVVIDELQEGNGNFFKRISHRGDIWGYSSIFKIYTSHIGVCIICNSEIGSTNLETIADRIYNTVKNEDLCEFDWSQAVITSLSKRSPSLFKVLFEHENDIYRLLNFLIMKYGSLEKAMQIESRKLSGSSILKSYECLDFEGMAKGVIQILRMYERDIIDTPTIPIS